MLQKWINPVKVPVSTLNIITFMNCSLTSRRSMIWSWVNTRTQTNKPWNWSTCWCAESLFSKTLQGHQLKPREQHWFQLDKTPTHSQFLTDQGLVWWGSTDNTTNYHSWKHGGGVLYLTERMHRLLLKVSHGWVPMASHCLGRHWNPHVYIHWHKSLLFHGSSERYLGSAVW